MKKPQNNFDGLLKHTRKPRTQERGKQHFSVVTPAVDLCECGHKKHEGQCTGTAPFSGYPCICKSYRERQRRVA